MEYYGTYNGVKVYYLNRAEYEANAADYALTSFYYWISDTGDLVQKNWLVGKVNGGIVKIFAAENWYKYIIEKPVEKKKIEKVVTNVIQDQFEFPTGVVDKFFADLALDEPVG